MLNYMTLGFRGIFPNNIFLINSITGFRYECISFKPGMHCKGCFAKTR